MKKTCENCFYLHIEKTDEGEKKYCNRYDCWTDEVIKEKENPSCWLYGETYNFNIESLKNLED